MKEPKKIVIGKEFMFKIILFVFVCVLVMAAFAATEIVLRRNYPSNTFGAGEEMTWMRESGKQDYTVDPDFGFRPILGQSYYSLAGTIINSYSFQKRAGVNRILFVGDSVTEDGLIIEALRHLYGDEHFEYWNAGVHSFNTVQEVEFYKRYNRYIKPDHIVLTFHNNDFETTPVAFFNEENQLIVYTPNTSIKNVSPWFFKHSYLYRIILGVLLEKRKDFGAIRNEIRESFGELKRLTAEDGARLTVLILPILNPYSIWTEEEKENHRAILKILEELGIRHFDLSPALERGLLDGIAAQRNKGDSWHPSGEISAGFAAYLQENNLLP